MNLYFHTIKDRVANATPARNSSVIELIFERESLPTVGVVFQGSYHLNSIGSSILNYIENKYPLENGRFFRNLNRPEARRILETEVHLVETHNKEKIEQILALQNPNLLNQLVTPIYQLGRLEIAVATGSNLFAMLTDDDLDYDTRWKLLSENLGMQYFCGDLAGVLTSAPILVSGGEYGVADDLYYIKNVDQARLFYYEDYVIRSEFDELSKTGKIVLKEAL